MCRSKGTVRPAHLTFFRSLFVVLFSLFSPLYTAPPMCRVDRKFFSRIRNFCEKHTVYRPEKYEPWRLFFLRLVAMAGTVRPAHLRKKDYGNLRKKFRFFYGQHGTSEVPCKGKNRRKMTFRAKSSTRFIEPWRLFFGRRSS